MHSFLLMEFFIKQDECENLEDTRHWIYSWVILNPLLSIFYNSV